MKRVNRQKKLGQKKFSQNELGKNNSGQIVIEYILLLIIAVGVALLITNVMVSRNPDNPGFLINKWTQLIHFIGNDPVEE